VSDGVERPSTDQQLRTLLRQEAERCVPPEPDLEAMLPQLRTASRRHVQHWRLAAVPAAAVVVALVATLAVAFLDDAIRVDSPGPGADLVTVESLPVGPAPDLPHCVDGRLVRGAGTDIEAPCTTMVHRGGSTVTADDGGVHLLEDGRRILLDRRPPSYWVPGLSHDGSRAAWVFETAGGEPRLLVVDLRTRRRLAEAPLPRVDVWVPGIDTRGRVLVASFATNESRWVYDIDDRQLLPVTGQPIGAGPVNYVTPEGYAVDTGWWFDTGRATSTSVEGIVDSEGRFWPRGSKPVGWSLHSPDGTHLVQETALGLVVQEVDDPGSAVTLDLPEVGRPTVLPVWESDGSVLVTFDPESDDRSILDSPQQGGDVPASRTWLLRCDADDGDCEVALGPGNGGDLWGPMYR
jgi:hypothetical protein